MRSNIGGIKMYLWALILYQLYTEQIPDLQLRIELSLPGTITSLISGVGCFYVRYCIGQQVLTSILVCTEGLLEIHPKKVGVTRWNEVKGPLQGPGIGKKKRYTLYRINRKPFSFGESFEDMEGLADLVRLYTQKAEQ